jgi:preprotein translocase subunit SecG
MENVILVIHLILAFSLVGIVLIQRSEGAALLSGGGPSQGRGQITGIAKVTWVLAAGFLATSIALTIVAAANSQGASVVDRLGAETAAPDVPAATPGLGGDLLPPTQDDTPVRAD